MGIDVILTRVKRSEPRAARGSCCCLGSRVVGWRSGKCGCGTFGCVVGMRGRLCGCVGGWMQRVGFRGRGVVEGWLRVCGEDAMNGCCEADGHECSVMEWCMHAVAEDERVERGGCVVCPSRRGFETWP